MNPQPLIAVQDVPTSRTWYETILGFSSSHGGNEYERMMFGDKLVLQLHHWDVHDHPHLGHPEKLIGNGMILWFQAESFDEIVSSIQKHNAKILEGPLINTNANHREIWLLDPDGYTVVIAGIPGDI